jgi:hypothetical protein
MYREKFPTPSEWREIAIRDCYEAIRNYNTWIALMKVQNGEIYIEKNFVRSTVLCFPATNVQKKRTEECDYCDASCEIGSGSTTCLLRVPQPYSSDVCFHARYCFKLPYEEVFRCRECAEKVLLKFSQETDLRR